MEIRQKDRISDRSVEFSKTSCQLYASVIHCYFSLLIYYYHQLPEEEKKEMEKEKENVKEKGKEKGKEKEMEMETGVSRPQPASTVLHPVKPIETPNPDSNPTDSEVYLSVQPILPFIHSASFDAVSVIFRRDFSQTCHPRSAPANPMGIVGSSAEA